MNRLLATLVFSLVLLGSTSAQAATWYVKSSGPSTTPSADSCARADVQAAVDATSPGDMVILGSGACGPYTTPISTLSHCAIEIRGAGTMPTMGATTPGGTSVAINSSNDSFDIFECAAGNTIISNITFTVAIGASRPAAPGSVIYCGSRGNGATPTLTDGICILHHITVTAHDLTIFDWASFQPLRGLLYRSIWQNDVLWSAGGLNNSSPKIVCKGSASYAPVNWASASTMGTADTTGTKNLYIENNTIINTVNAVDIDDGCKVVMRYNTFQDAEPTDHGHDTSIHGLRHTELYNNTFSCVAATAWDFNGAAGWHASRGGTWVIADNIAPHTCFGITRAPWSASIYALRRLLQEKLSTTGTTSSGSAVITGLVSTAGVLANQSVYGSNIPVSATVNSVDSPSQVTISAAAVGSGSITIGFADCYGGPYPWLRQQGWGWAGSGDETNQILEPAYIWNNKYTSGGTTGEADTFTAYDSPSVCAFDNSGQTSPGYIQQNREYYLGVAKPSYTKYTYPHPLAESSAVSYTITASTGANGSISPSGSVTVASGASQVFTFTANSGYHVSSVLVDGVSAGAVSTYTFVGVSADHTISVTFAINTYTISGTITLSGSPLAGVSIAGASCSVTDSLGQYSCDVASGFSGMLTPSLAGYTFVPATQSYVSVVANQTSQNYVATSTATLTISGTVTLNGSPLASVALSGATCSVTNSLGQYTCTVNSGFSGTVVPILAHYIFTPASFLYSSIVSNQIGKNHLATVTDNRGKTMFHGKGRFGGKVIIH